MPSSPPLTLEWRRSRIQRVVLLVLGLASTSIGWWIPRWVWALACVVAAVALWQAWPRRVGGRLSLDVQQGLRVDEGPWRVLVRMSSGPGLLVLQSRGATPLWLWQDMFAAADWCALRRWLRLQDWTRRAQD